MLKTAFINADNLMDFTTAFAKSIQSVDPQEDKDDIQVAVIGEPGVGKSYIATKLAHRILAENVITHTQTIQRDDMHDLVLWSVHSDGVQEIVQYDEASLRFVDEDYHNFVVAHQQQTPMPERTLPGLTFIEHPDQDTEYESDIVVRISFSDMQRQDLQNIRKEIQYCAANIEEKRAQLAAVAAQGCVIEVETQDIRMDYTALKQFFDDADELSSTGYEDDEDPYYGNYDLSF